jgi:outer membrane protein OmpA-like peptidoglycan-associated protein
VAITGEQDAREPEAREVAETETLPPSSNEVESASDEAPEPSEAEPEEPPADVAPQEPERGAEPSAEEVTEETQGNAGGEEASASVRPSVQDAPAAKTEAAPVEEEVTEGTQGNADSEEASTSVWPSVQAQRLAEGKAARVYFPPDSAELTAPAKAELDAILHVLSRNAGKPVAIVGHCALFGTEQGRIELSEARARHVRRYLLDAGWQPAKDPATRGVGAAEPLTREPDGQAKNRRVELRFVDSAS